MARKKLNKNEREDELNVHSADDIRVTEHTGARDVGDADANTAKRPDGSVLFASPATSDLRMAGSAVGARTVVAIFTDWLAASRAVDDLQTAGFSETEIGIARMDRDGGAVHSTGAVKDDQAGHVASGVATGAAVGGVTGLLAALGSLLIPGVGPIIAGGVLASVFGATAGAAIAGAGVGAGVGAVAGGLIGALTGLGLPEEDARYYDEELRRGSTLVTVSASTDRRAAEAIGLLERHGGQTRSHAPA